MAAVLGEMTRLPRGTSRASTFPAGSRTSFSACAGWWIPPAAIVAYASVISSGVTGCEPSVIEQTGSSLEWMPSPCAVATTCSGPTLVTSCAKIVLTECAVASIRFM